MKNHHVKRTFFITTLFFFLITAYIPANAFNNTNEDTKGWKAGVARTVITPNYPMWMGGYAGRTTSSQGKLHDLWAKALVLEDAQGKQAVLITTDVLGMTREITDRIHAQLKQKFKLEPAQIMINSSHTHTGPVLQNALYDIYPLDAGEIDKIEKYTKWFEKEIVSLVTKAFKSLEPVHIYAGNGVSRFQVNRRNNNPRKLLEQTELEGPNDFAVPVIKVENKSGKIIAIAFGYACHSTVLSINLWSGDYAGYAQIELEKYYPGTTAMFFQGAGADQNPLPRRTIPLAQQYGRDLAAAVDRVLNEDMNELSPKLVTAYSEIEIPFSLAPTIKELTKVKESGTDYEICWAKRMLEKLKNGESFRTSYPYPVQIWQMGIQKIFGMGGEVVIEYAIKLKQIFGQDIFVMGYTNDVMGYIPSTTILNEGGYEGATSHIVYGLPATWESNVEILILDKIVNMAKLAGITLLEKPISDKTLIAKRYCQRWQYLLCPVIDNQR